VQLSSKRQLFVDSYLIEEMDGLHKKVHQPTKYLGNPVLRADRPWEKAVRTNGAPSVLYDPPEPDCSRSGISPITLSQSHPGIFQ
jgi:hypothetical protein